MGASVSFSLEPFSAEHESITNTPCGYLVGIGDDSSVVIPGNPLEPNDHPAGFDRDYFSRKNALLVLIVPPGQVVLRATGIE